MKKIVTAFSVKFLLIFSIFNKKNYTFAVINISNYVNIYYNPPFYFRAYRSTDYLVNDAEKLNASKYAELQDRITNPVE
jgi:hypothetical protein